MKSKLTDGIFPLTGMLILLLLVGIFALTGCGSTKVTTQDKASVGQQLLDLDKAHSQGVISDKEYQKLRRRIVKDND